MIAQEAVDTHVHVVDQERFPYSPGPGYKPGPDEQGPCDALEDVLSSHGLRHAVIVQLSGHGSDNLPILDAIARSNGRFKGIAIVDPKIDDRSLAALSSGGIVGVRLNVVNLGREALARAERLIPRIGELGWVTQVQCQAQLLPEFLPVLKRSRDRLLIDHLGLPDVSKGTADPGFRALLALGGEGSTIKLSGAFRVSRASFPHPDLDPFVHEIRKAYPAGQRVWGSDWPFVACESRPAYADTLAQLEHWLPDAADRRMALVETPRRLFNLGPVT